MAVAGNSIFSREDLLQDGGFFNNDESAQPKSFSVKAKAALQEVIKKTTERIQTFLSQEVLNNASTFMTRSLKTNANRRILHTLVTPIYSAPILERESRLWLDSL